MTKVQNIYDSEFYFDASHVFEGWFPVGGVQTFFKEEWRRIHNADDGYCISNFGRIKSRKKILRPCLFKDGYYHCSLRNSSRMKGVTGVIARNVCIAFNGTPPTKSHQANHINGVKHENYAWNTEWTTPKENVAHAMKSGLVKHPRGLYSRRGTPIAKIDIISGEIIAVYATAKDASIEMGLKPGSNANIANCARGVRNIAYGFKWKRITREEYFAHKQSLK